MEYNTVHLGWTVELLYTQYQQNYGDNFTPPKWQRRTDVYYLSMPILFRYTLDYVINIEAGVELSLLQSARGDYIYDSEFKSKGFPQAVITDYYSKFNAAGLVRIGKDIKVGGNIALTVGACFSYGFWDIIGKPDKGTDYVQDPKAPDETEPYKATRTMYEGVWIALGFRK